MRILLWCVAGGNLGLLIAAMVSGNNRDMTLGLLGLTISVVGLYRTREDP